MRADHGMKELTVIDSQGISYSLFVHPEEIPPEDMLISGEPDYAELDAREVERVRREVDAGNIWAWASVTVVASIGGFEGTDYLGCCSYESAEDFTANGGYWDDMKAESRDNLLDNIRSKSLASVNVLTELVTGEAPKSLADQLKERFPWLGTDEEVSGADVIDSLNKWFADLS